ncbi:hypothetical protein L905_20950 [Agrobacterium sp. TS43]|nr:hypothetical protein L906_24295 [Agrobacterium sp. TS45]KVK62572.1 hypothetical protein L905_20950 [Agrobacterium sp. TS43]KVK63888.1 hypothetical protein L907_24245 [Agrobacterium sp. C13]
MTVEAQAVSSIDAPAIRKIAAGTARDDLLDMEVPFCGDLRRDRNRLLQVHCTGKAGRSGWHPLKAAMPELPVSEAGDVAADMCRQAIPLSWDSAGFVVQEAIFHLLQLRIICNND